MKYPPIRGAALFDTILVNTLLEFMYRLDQINRIGEGIKPVVHTAGIFYFLIFLKKIEKNLE